MTVELLLKKWTEFIQEDYVPMCDGNTISEDDAVDVWDDAVDEFCRKFNYTPQTKERIYGAWYIDFKDEFWRALDNAGVKLAERHIPRSRGDLR